MAAGLHVHHFLPLLDPENMLRCSLRRKRFLLKNEERRRSRKSKIEERHEEPEKWNVSSHFTTSNFTSFPWEVFRYRKGKRDSCVLDREKWKLEIESGMDCVSQEWCFLKQCSYHKEKVNKGKVNFIFLLLFLVKIKFFESQEG